MVENRFDLALVAYVLSGPQSEGGLERAVVVRGVSLELIDIKNVMDPPSAIEVRDLERMFTILFAQCEGA
jgi:hypothetical protein